LAGFEHTQKSLIFGGALTAFGSIPAWAYPRYWRDLNTHKNL
jgi:hypothetical protein